ncbi:MAG: mandelate racemase [Betaproteobacteria bacterium]|nr:mandelate racemase [Betaproteobacteria bacterium]
MPATQGAAPRFTIRSIELFERDVRLRLPFRFGVVTLTESPQAFVRAHIRLEDGRESPGAAAELLAPKWFDKNLALSNEDNFDQLRRSLEIARSAYLSGGANTAFGRFSAHYRAQIEACAKHELNPLVACYGPALLDRALLDALCRALGVSFYAAMRANLPGVDASLTADLAGFDLGDFLGSLAPAASIAARHTVGLVDPITAADQKERVGDGLPETLEEVVARYGHNFFKLKVGGDIAADIARLGAIAAVLDRSRESYFASLDGNEQYENVDGIAELWRRMTEAPQLARLAASVLFIEQPIKRQNALTADVSALGRRRPVIIDESDDSLDAFPRARALGYAGVSSKACKGLYKSVLNAARCVKWNSQGGKFFMSAEDLTIQPGLALQQDLALVNLLGITHVERNGHHYVNGMASLPESEQRAFLAAHPDLYESSHGATRVAIHNGRLAIGSLDCPGFASRALPEFAAMRAMRQP